MFLIAPNYTSYFFPVTLLNMDILSELHTQYLYKTLYILRQLLVKIFHILKWNLCWIYKRKPVCKAQSDLTQRY